MIASPKVPAIYRVGVQLVTALALVGCGGGGGDGSTGPVAIVSSITVTAPASTLEVNQAYQFSAIARDAQGVTVLTPLSWSVNPSSRGAITAEGIFTPTSVGGASIIATASGVSGNSQVSVVDNGVPTSADVLMSGEIFLPFNTTIRVNGTVRFNFPPGAQHNVIFTKKNGSPQDILQTSNVIVSRTFAVIGTFPFDCTIHPGMSGQITVQ